MTFDDLLAEAKAIARPSVRLTSIANGPVVGRWRGPRRKDAPRGLTQLLTFDARCLLPYLPATGTFTLYADIESEHAEFVQSQDFGDFESAPRANRREFDVTRVGAATTGRMREWTDLRRKAIPLFAHRVDSLPSLGQLVKFGSSSVQQWASRIGWQAEDFLNSVMSDVPARHRASADAARRYADYFLRTTLGSDEPAFTMDLAVNETFAIIGGWRIHVPFASYELPPRQRWLMTVFAESEPYREVWYDEEFRWHVHHRIT